MRASLPAQLTAAALVSLAVAPTARADAGPPPPPAAIDQYRESIPGAIGSVVPGSARPTSHPLPPAVRSSVVRQAGSDAQLLTRVATRSDYGAPPQPARPRRPEPPPPDRAAVPSVSAVTGALSSAGAAHLDRLAVVLAAISVAAAGLALRRRSA